MLALAGIGAQFAGLYAWSRARAGMAPGPLFVISLALLAASFAAFVSGSGAALGISRAFLSVSLVAYVLVVSEPGRDTSVPGTHLAAGRDSLGRVLVLVMLAWVVQRVFVEHTSGVHLLM